MKKFLSIMITLVILAATATAFAADANSNSTDWIKTNGQISWLWPTVSFKGNGSGLALVDWDMLPATLGSGRVYKGVATKAHWAGYYGGATISHDMGVLSDNEESFTEVFPTEVKLLDISTLKAAGYDTTDVLDFMLSAGGAYVLRHDNGLTGLAQIQKTLGKLVAEFRFKDGGWGYIAICPDGKLAIVINPATGGSHKADEPTKDDEDHSEYHFHQGEDTREGSSEDHSEYHFHEGSDSTSDSGFNWGSADEWNQNHSQQSSQGGTEDHSSYHFH